jgi:hypothetical protein
MVTSPPSSAIAGTAPVTARPAAIAADRTIDNARFFICKNLLFNLKAAFVNASLVNCVCCVDLLYCFCCVAFVVLLLLCCFCCVAFVVLLLLACFCWLVFVGLS